MVQEGILMMSRTKVLRDLADSNIMNCKKDLHFVKVTERRIRTDVVPVQAGLQEKGVGK